MAAPGSGMVTVVIVSVDSGGGRGGEDKRDDKEDYGGGESDGRGVGSDANHDD